MTPHDIIAKALRGARKRTDLSYDDLAQRILEHLALHAFVVVHADRVIQQDGKVTVSRSLVESVLADAEENVRREYFVGGLLHPAMASRYERDMCDIRLLRAEIGGEANE